MGVKCIAQKENYRFPYWQYSTESCEVCDDLLTRIHKERNLRSYLSKKHHGELAGESLIALQLLNVPATLNKSLLSTNLIENPFRNVRAKIGRVKRWRSETDQPSRWMAYALLEAEKGFHRIKGYKDIHLLVEELKRKIPSVSSRRENLKEKQPLADMNP